MRRFLPVAVVLGGLLVGPAASETAKGKGGPGDPELQAVKKELAELMAQIAVKEKELAELKKRAAPLRARLAEAKLTRAVEAAIQEARRHPRNSKMALELLREMVSEVWDNAEISEGVRGTLLSRLVAARGEIV